MSLLTPLVSPPNGTPSPPQGLARPADGDRRDLPVPPVERGHPARPVRDDRPQRPDAREPGRRQARTEAAPDRPAQRSRALVLVAEEATPASGLAVFLVQVLGQDRDPPAHGLSGHRDAAALGSDAYRRAGGTPPIFSDEPAVFRITA